MKAVQNEIQIPEIAEKQNKKKTWIVAAGILVACFIVVAVSIVAIIKIYNTDERKLLKGFMNLAEEVGEWNEVWERETGRNLVDYMDKAKFTGVLNLSSEELPITVGIDLVSMQDVDAKKMQSSMTVSVSNIDLAEITVYGDEKQMIVAMPDFWRQNLAFKTNHIEKQYNNSLWADMLGEIDNEEISIDLFAEQEEQNIEIDVEQLVEEWKELKESGLTIEKLDKTVEIDVQSRNNTVYQCSQYRIVIPQELAESLIELGNSDGGEENEKQPENTVEEIVSDIVLLVSMDKSNQIVQLQFEKPLALSTGAGENIEFSGYMMFLGKERSIDDMLVRLKWSIPMEVMELDDETKNALESFGKSEDLLDTIEVVTDMNIIFNENDVSVFTDLDKLTMSVDSLGTYKLTGSVKVEPLEETIKPLEGETIQLFQITQEELEDLQNQLLKNLDKWSAAIDSIY